MRYFLIQYLIWNVIVQHQTIVMINILQESLTLTLYLEVDSKRKSK